MANHIETLDSGIILSHWLDRIPLFSTLTPARRKELAESGITIHPAKGKVLFLHGDPSPFFYLIKTGWIKLFRETLDGAQAVVDIMNGGHLIAETALFDNDRYPYSAEAVEASELVSFPMSFLKKELDSNPAFTMAFLRSMTTRQIRLDHEIEQRVLQTAPQRIGCFILRLMDQKKSGPQTIHLPYDKTLVAARLGMQPETFSRALAKLRDETNLQIKGATIEIPRPEELSTYTCMACSSEYPCQDLKSQQCGKCS